MSSDITIAQIHSLLESFSKTVYRAKDSEQGTLNNEVMERCLNLFKLDYNTVEISNRSGELSSHYPSLIVIPENEKQKLNGCFSNIFNNSTSTISGSTMQSSSTSTLTPSLSSATSSVSNSSSTQRTQQQTIYENSFDSVRLRELMNKARFARSRTRFPTPVILYKGKFVCRSSTLSGGPELYTRTSFNYLFNVSAPTEARSGDDIDSCREDDDAIEVNESFTDDQEGEKPSNSDWPLFDNVRSNDIRLLKTFNVGTIVDFMVEKKKVKFGLKVTSSEKVDKENRYADFTIVSLPYPGCEFFREFRDNNYSHDQLVFDWSQTHVNAEIGVPIDPISAQFKNVIQWDQYKVWDLVTITQNYLKLCLKYLQENSSGLLIHCISGWDRTPLFVSLLRISLWADGVIHQSLNALQILFLTLAYDWYLFGHDLPDRLSKGEEIFVFCFYALKYIQDEEFSVNRHRSKHNSSGSSSIAVIPPDYETNAENLQFDVDSRGSSVSLSSAGSQQDIYQTKSSCNDVYTEHTNGNISNLVLNQDSNSSIEILTEPPSLNSYSPIPKRRTSPVTVPFSSLSRQRNESTSSVGSWQMVNQSGSLRSTDSGNLLQNLRTQNSNSQESNSTLVDDDIFGSSPSAGLLRRHDRLSSVRSLFYQCYCTAIGLKYTNSSESSSIGSMLGNFAERVGFSQRTPM